MIVFNFYYDPSDSIQGREQGEALLFAKRLKNEEFGVQRPKGLSVVKEALLDISKPQCVVLGTSQVYWLGSTPFEITPHCNEKTMINMSLPGLGFDELVLFANTARINRAPVVFLTVPFYLYSWNNSQRWPPSYRSQFQKSFVAFGLESPMDHFFSLIDQRLRYLISYQTLLSSFKLFFLKVAKDYPNSLDYQPLSRSVSIKNPNLGALLPNGAVIWKEKDYLELALSNQAEYQSFFNEVQSVIGDWTLEKPIIKQIEDREWLLKIKLLVQVLSENGQRVILYIPPLDTDFLMTKGDKNMIDFLQSYESQVIRLGQETGAEVRGGVSLCRSDEFYDGLHPKIDCLEKAIKTNSHNPPRDG